MALEISEIKVFSSNFKNGPSVGYGSITLSEAIIIRFGICKSNSGSLFVSWPQKKRKEDYTSLVLFTSGEVKNKIDKVVLDEYNRKVGIMPQSKSDPVEVVVKFSGSEPESDDSDNSSPIVPRDEEPPFEEQEDTPVQEQSAPNKRKSITWA
jgi:DNA-binding cell septation regulator SpoVG